MIQTRSRRKAARAAWPIALALSALGGCSFFMYENPSSWTPRQPPPCSDSRVPHALDVAGGLVTLIGPALLIARWADNDVFCSGDETGTCDATVKLGAVLTVASVVYWVAAVRGHILATRCRRAWKSFEGWKEAERRRERRLRR